MMMVMMIGVIIVIMIIIVIIGVTSMSTGVQGLKTSGDTPTLMYLQGLNHINIQ